MGAIHGWWCNAKTIPMICKYCDEDIFWFSCDCGSSKMFDELGDPWPEHNCRGSGSNSFVFQSPRKKKKKKRDKYGMSKKDWKRLRKLLTEEESRTVLNQLTNKQRKNLRKALKKLAEYS